MSNDDDDIDDIVKRGPDVIGGMGHAQKAQAAALRRHNQRDEDRAALEADLNKIGARLILDHAGQVTVQCSTEQRGNVARILAAHNIVVTGNSVIAEGQRDPQLAKQKKLKDIVATIQTSVYDYAKRNYLEPLQVERVNLDTIMPANRVALGHVLWMCNECDGFIIQGRLDKANRWIGFMQAILWVAGVASIEESRQVNT